MEHKQPLWYVNALINAEMGPPLSDDYEPVSPALLERVLPLAGWTVGDWHAAIEEEEQE